MAHSKMIRNFIILQEDEKNQSMSKEKPLSGYAKIEAKGDKCKISFYAQNVKKDNNKCFMTLICYKKDDKKIICIGELNIGAHGKCDNSVEFPIDDIAGLGVSADKIIGAAVYKETMGKPVYLMYGFMNGQIPKEEWKQFDLIAMEKSKLDTSTPKANNVAETEKTEEEMHNEMEQGVTGAQGSQPTAEAQPTGENQGSQEQPETATPEAGTMAATFDNMQPTYADNYQEYIRTEPQQTEASSYMNGSPRGVDEDFSIESRLDDDLLRNLKVKAITQEIEEFKDRIFAINKKNEETILNELNKFKETCLAQLGNVADVVAKPFSNKKDENNSQNRSMSIFDQYERQIEENKYLSEQQLLDSYQLRGNVADYFEDVLSEYDEARGYIRDIKYCKWYKVPVTSMQQMHNKNSVDKQKIVYNLMMNNYPYIIKHGHFLFGIKGDKEGKAKYLVYAVPGTKDEKDQPYGGKSGFVTWVPGPDKNSDLGYWLLFYDYKNQIIAVPMK
ncbi:hypothetical protein [Inconstantimicrobium mannanitabidum]|uniref:Uncharacterized protein n=1 Tax=Inconstantimicrobium mannanitabidum TaxID=1604901 RepID=A0ACB5RHV0_9CLOT|nr:hypothetical protein [Clostridium sp. TW13]GKX68685.1 hypothetical protein rsdtw13_39430 [Clostridium sp. TW13]